ncbi:MAG: COQ9 family protein [Pseudomonadota bacterium]
MTTTDPAGDGDAPVRETPPVDPFDDRRRAVLAALLDEAPFCGFSVSALRAAGEQAGEGKAELALLFPKGVRDVIDFWSRTADLEALERFAALDRSEMRIRDQVTAAVRLRIEALEPHKEAARRVAATLALPLYAGLAPRIAWRTADGIWRACGDRATDFNHYSKRAILSGVYLSTLAAWQADETGERWPSFLDARIDNVMQFEKVKARAKKAGIDPAAPWRLLGALRYGPAVRDQ